MLAVSQEGGQHCVHCIAVLAQRSHHHRSSKSGGLPLSHPGRGSHPKGLAGHRIFIF